MISKKIKEFRINNKFVDKSYDIAKLYKMN